MAETVWEKVHFSNESKFNLVGSDGRQFVHRVARDRLNPRKVKKSVKFGGGSVIVWGYYHQKGFGICFD